MLEVYKDVKYGEEVFVSKSAEEGRKNGCLCINGCKRLSNNALWQKEKMMLEAVNLGYQFKNDEEVDFFEAFRKSPIGRELLSKIIIEATEDWYFANQNERKARLTHMTPESPCPIATANFAVCLTGGIANGVARCPYFLPDEKKVKIIDKPNVDTNQVSSAC